MKHQECFEDLGFKSGEFVLCTGTTFADRMVGKIFRLDTMFMSSELSILVDGDDCRGLSATGRKWRKPQSYEIANKGVTKLTSDLLEYEAILDSGDDNPRPKQSFESLGFRIGNLALCTSSPTTPDLEGRIFELDWIDAGYDLVIYIDGNELHGLMAGDRSWRKPTDAEVAEKGVSRLTSEMLRKV